jgi:hypothetical protein
MLMKHLIPAVDRDAAVHRAPECLRAASDLKGFASSDAGHHFRCKVVGQTPCFRRAAPQASAQMTPFDTLSLKLRTT